MATVDVSGIVAQLVGEATKTGGDTWKRIQKSAPLYFRGYAQGLADIADGVLAGEITPAEAKIYTQNAHLLLVQGIANTSHVVLFQVQTFVNKVLDVLKTSINAALPVKLL